MTLRILSLLCLLCSFVEMHAAFSVTGRVSSATDDTPLSGATVRLLHLPDSTFIVGGYSDANGLFVLPVTRLEHKSGSTERLCVYVTYMGFQQGVKVFTVRSTSKNVSLPDIYLQESLNAIAETVVSATPPPMLIREDTIEYYADSYKTQPDATVEDLMKRLPGVEVAEDGTITAQGETVQQVYVDGKEFFGRNIQATTKNLTADMLESVQVVDMKTEESRLTGIDDGERRKVINLKLKPKMRRGWFGNVAGALGDGNDIDMRWETRGMAGYFRGNMQNALVASGGNTNNAGFGDMGDNVMGSSSMRGRRNSGRRGDGLNTSWSTGLNINYDEGNRMRDQNTPFSVGGDVLYGGSSQDEYSRNHTINYLKTGNTASDSYNTGSNNSQNVQLNVKWEKSWGEKGAHRLQINPTLQFNRTKTDEWTSSLRYRAGDEMTAALDTFHTAFLSQSERSTHFDQQGLRYGLSSTYSYQMQTSRGRRRSSVTLDFQGSVNDGDQYTQSYTSYDSAYVANLSLNSDTVINQWQEETNRRNSLRVRLTHMEPLAPNQFLELSLSGNLADSHAEHLYHFRNGTAWSDSVNGVSSAAYNSDTRTVQSSLTGTVAYRFVNTKRNLNIGIDIIPQRQRYEDAFDHDRDYTRRYVNYAPRLEYRYYWDRRTYLRVTVNGKTQQPSASQLLTRKNQSSATHVSLGNSDLDPSYNMDLRVNYRSFNAETYRTHEATIQARGSWNNLSSKRWYSADLRTDTTMTVNIAGLGSWSVSGSYRGSYPFYDNLWYVTTYTQVSYSLSKGYASLQSADSQINKTESTSASEQAGIAYRGEKLNVELHANYAIQYATASVVSNSSLGTTHRFGGRMNVSWQLPSQFRLSTDINYTARRGYSAGVTRNQTIWNAQLSRTFLRRQNLSAFVKVFDILGQKSSVSRSISATSMVDRETTTLGRYFLAGCSVKFNQMGGRRGGRGGGRGGERGGNRRDRSDEPNMMGGAGSMGGPGGERGTTVETRTDESNAASGSASGGVGSGGPQD